MNVEAPLRLKPIGVSKSFPGVRANDNVNLSVKAGEVHALLGENGAGKSTLVKMIYGILAPDEGRSSSTARPSASEIRGPPGNSASAWCFSTFRCSRR